MLKSKIQCNVQCSIYEFPNKTIDVEILVFDVYKNPLILREVHMIGRTMLITILNRRNGENS